MIRYLRVRRSLLQTPVCAYQHPHGGWVVVVATMHVGEPAYYAQLRTLIDRLHTAGAVVQMEDCVAAAPAADIVSADEAAAFAELGTATELARRRYAELGWTTQREAMRPAVTWQQVDLDPLTILRLVGTTAMRRRQQHLIRQLNWPTANTAALYRFRLRIAVEHRLFANHLAQRLLARSTDPVLLQRRNQHALHALDQADGAVVLVWGYRHLPGLHAGLRQRGYQRTTCEWHTVARLPSTLNATRHLVLCRRVGGSADLTRQ